MRKVRSFRPIGAGRRGPAEVKTTSDAFGFGLANDGVAARPLRTASAYGYEQTHGTQTG
jgi:hypothetical protein